MSAPFNSPPMMSALLSEQRFRMLVDSIRDYAIFLLSAEGIVASWNPGAQKFKGYEAEEIIGRHFSVFYSDEDNAAGKPAMELAQAAATGRVEDEGWRLRKDGSRFWANVVITALRAPSGELIGFGKVTRDLTDRRLVEERLRESQEQLRLLIDSVPDYAMFLVDPDGRVLTWNAGAERIDRYKLDEIIGRHISVFYPDDGVARANRELELARATGRTEDDGWRLRKDGTQFWANQVISAIHGTLGEFVGFSMVLRDLTVQREQQDALEQALRDLRASNRELDEYASFVAHDLQEPLRKMASFAELLQFTAGPALDAQGRGYVRNVVEGAQRMRTLITDVLDYARIGSGRMVLDRVDLGQVAQLALADLEVAARECDAEVDIGPLPIVHGHEGRLVSVVQNLLSNAMKYRVSGRPPRIVVRAERAGTDWVISVRDNGIGFDPALGERIMRPFQRLHSKERYPGSGLGLASARKIMELLGGRLWGTSEPGKGSTFYFALRGAS